MGGQCSRGGNAESWDGWTEVQLALRDSQSLAGVEETSPAPQAQAGAVGPSPPAGEQGEQPETMQSVLTELGAAADSGRRMDSGVQEDSEAALDSAAGRQCWQGEEAAVGANRGGEAAAANLACGRAPVSQPPRPHSHWVGWGALRGFGRGCGADDTYY